MKKHLLIIAVAILLIIVTMGCKKEKAVTSVTLNKANITLAIGDMAELTATVLPYDATNKAITWASSNLLIAVVDNGKVTAIAAGTATVTVITADGNYTAECVVTVTPDPDEGPGVLIDGIRWATCNVLRPGVFTAKPEDFGMLYQFNRRVGWSSTYPMQNTNGGTEWDTSFNLDDNWVKANDPCPSGWRVPKRTELERLATVESEWITLNGTEGRRFGSGTNTIFFPAVGYRMNADGLLISSREGYYWSGNNRWFMEFNSTEVSMRGRDGRYGHSVRCVAE